MAPALPGRAASLWTDTAPAPPRPPLSSDTRADVCVVGAGVCGLTTALLLARAGADVVVLDAHRAGHGVSGHTTAKVTALHGVVYDELRRRHDARTAREYAAAQVDGMELVLELVAELGIDCDLRRRAAYTYAEQPQGRPSIEREVAAGREAGLATTLTTQTPLPFEVAAAVRLDDQLELHAGRYLEGLAAGVEAGGGRIFEHTMATGASVDGIPRVTTACGAIVTAGRIIVATLYPFLDRGLFWTRLLPQRSYAIAAPARDQVPDGMFLSIDEPARSVRATPGAPAGVDGELLIVGGEGHATGEAGSTTPDRYRRLATWARERLGAGEATHRWSAHDLVSADGLPFAGPLTPGSDRILTAGGFRKWGWTNAGAAALVLAAQAQDAEHGLADLFDPWRPTLRQTARGVARAGLKTARHLVGDWAAVAAGGGDGAPLRRGEARVIRDGARAVAAHRDDDGFVHAVSARCTHLGCRVAWNSAERTWDCPCHGSRFSPDGDVLQGPATRPLERASVPGPVAP